jgi:hypothetical protein
MKTLKRLSFLSILVLAVATGALAGQVEPEKLYYGIEINDVLCGYSELETSAMEQDGKELVLLEHRVFVMISALGSKFDQEITLTYHIDPATGRFTHHDSNIEQGTTHLDSAIRVEGETARCTSSLSKDEKVVELGPGVILENTLFFPHLVRDFVGSDLDEKTYDIFEVREEAVQRATYTRAGAETVELAGRSYDTILLDRLSQATGLKSRLWIDTATGRVVKVEAPNNRESYLADASVVKKIEVANLDENLIAKVGVAIPDVHGISRVKVRARIEPSGMWVTPESLNVSGQSFTGTVEDNLVDGVFEVELPRYDGANAPPFPPEFGADESLQAYLEPADFIESDDPELVATAREITAGSEDCWEAARRLSGWVAENIDYAIPGGVTAKGTYDTRTGECGAHSFLFAALSRAVGIPARVVWGCTYVPSHGGGFGQHGWNEVYMGEAGWIPLDTTAFEIDFVDSGHIRIGEIGSMTIALNPIEMELLDYRVGSGETVDPQGAGAEKYARFLGEYTNVDLGKKVMVKQQGGALVLDVPGQVVLSLHDPDEQERWYCTMTNRVYCTFDEDEAGEVREMQIHEIIRMRRTAAPEEIPEEVPAEYGPYLGTYLLAQVQAEFTVVFDDGRLAMEDPLARKTIHLQPPDEHGGWLDEFGKNTIRFETSAAGEVEALVVDSVSRFRR